MGQRFCLVGPHAKLRELVTGDLVGLEFTRLPTRPIEQPLLGKSGFLGNRGRT